MDIEDYLRGNPISVGEILNKCKMEATIEYDGRPFNGWQSQKIIVVFKTICTRLL